MTLFFETNTQADSFILMVPWGFLVPVLLDLLLTMNRKILPVMDAFVLSGLGVTGYILLETSNIGEVRLYHLLGGICGAILYTQGIRKTVTYLLRKRNLKKEFATQIKKI